MSKYHYTITDIEWDTDGEDVRLPLEVSFTSDRRMSEDELGDYLTDTNGFCHNGFLYEEEKLPANKPHKAEIRLSKGELKHYEKLLASEGLNYDDLGVGELSRYVTFTAEFDDGRLADININTNCREDGDMYAEMCLHEENGAFIACTEPQYDLRGVWRLDADDCQEYEVEVVAE